MTGNLPSTIATWFAAHEDGEFLQPGDEHQYFITPAIAQARWVLYATKPSTVLVSLDRGGCLGKLQVIGRPGLPRPEHVAWLRELAGAKPLRFLGDCDCADLLIYA